MQNSRRQYLTDRQTEKWAAYDVATDPRARDLHLQLAERYADAIWSAEEAEYESGKAGYLTNEGNDRWLMQNRT